MMLIDPDATREKAEDEIVETFDTCAETDMGVRMQLLNLAKEILQHKAAMRWETHKQIEDITIDSLIEETRKLYSFVTEN